MAVKTGIGLMSGTSGDGVDSALVRFSSGKPECIATDHMNFPAKLRSDIVLASRPDGRAELICELNVRIGKILGQAALRLAKKSGFGIEKVNFIGSHGQTIRHQPSSKGVSSTLQIGEAAEISAGTGCTVVSDFRPADIAAGGCGAPLAPLGHYHMFTDRSGDRIVQNLGGISNITWLPKRGGVESVTGFDTGPANSLLDLASERFSRGSKHYDAGGRTALKGSLNRKLFDYCMSHPFYGKRPPKSTGREQFGVDYFNEILHRFRSVGREDFLRTLAAVTAESSVRQAMRFFSPKKSVRWIVCGGGALNRAVISELKERLKGKGEVFLSRQFGFAEKSVEAVLMAILAYRTMAGLPGNLPKVTGAKRPVILGKILRPISR